MVHFEVKLQGCGKKNRKNAKKARPGRFFFVDKAAGGWYTGGGGFFMPAILERPEVTEDAAFFATPFDDGAGEELDEFWATMPVPPELEFTSLADLEAKLAEAEEDERMGRMRDFDEALAEVRTKYGLW
jgi:hypothetical protein